MDLKTIFEKHVENYLGVLILLNILHQIISSMAFVEGREDLILYGGIFFQVSMYIFSVEFGDRIAQMVICPIEQINLEEVDNLDNTKRGIGGFGSTGEKIS